MLQSRDSKLPRNRRLPELRKLTEAHLETVFVLKAEGAGNTEIARLLSQGTNSTTGAPLTPVQVDESNIRYHCRSSKGQARIDHFKTQLFGSVFEHKASFTAWRLGELSKLLELAHAGANEAEDDACRRSYSRLAVSISKEIRQEMDRIEPSNRVKITGTNGATTQVDDPLLAKIIGDLVEGSGLSANG